MSGDRHTVNGEDRLRDSKDKQIGIRWPIALDQRLDDLVLLANDSGAGTNRRETIAALLLAADLTGDELLEAIRRFRTAKVKDAPLTPGAHGASILEFRAHGPGPRTPA